jgi:acetyl-CoA carboxylase biotin carboxylase subunit
MNTRLQVEHPVTELVTGLDLVDWQFRVASGERLDFTQDDVRLRGHAIECRITSEDPATGFLPSTGIVDHLEIPSGPGVRWDGGIQQGHEVTLHYDPLLAKLIVYANDRRSAIARMARALDELVITGVDTSTPFHRRVMREAHFRDGDFSIEYVADHPELLSPQPTDEMLTAAAVSAALLEEEYRRRRRAPRMVAGPRTNPSAWRASAMPGGAEPWKGP